MASDFSIAKNAIEQAMHWLRSQPAPEQATSKGVLRDLVTAHDREVQKQIASQLEQTAFPILGEEKIDNQNSPLHPDKKFWAVDPIDGTVNYFHRIPYYAVSIGLVSLDRSIPTFHWGAVAVPSVQEIFCGGSAEPPTLGQASIRCNATGLDQSLCAMGFPNLETHPDRQKLMYESFAHLNQNSRGCLRTGSAAANLAYVASSRLQLVLGFGNQIWDIAGGCAVALAAGAEVWVDPQADDKLDYLVGTPPAVRSVLGMLASRGKTFQQAKLAP